MGGGRRERETERNEYSRDCCLTGCAAVWGDDCAGEATPGARLRWLRVEGGGGLTEMDDNGQ